MESPFGEAVKVVAAAFAAVLGFVGFATWLGGGYYGFGAATVFAAAVVGLTAWSIRRTRRKTAQRAAEKADNRPSTVAPTSSGSLVAKPPLPSSSGSAISPPVARTPRPPVRQSPPPPSPSAQHAAKPRSLAEETNSDTRAQPPSAIPIRFDGRNPILTPPKAVEEPMGINGTYKIEANGHVALRLDLDPGDILLGRLTEEDGYDFGWQILHEKSVVELDRGRSVKPVAEDLGHPAYFIEWKALPRGPFFLILDASRKQYPRTVTVDLRRKRQIQG